MKSLNDNRLKPFILYFLKIVNWGFEPFFCLFEMLLGKPVLGWSERRCEKSISKTCCRHVLLIAMVCNVVCVETWNMVVGIGVQKGKKMSPDVEKKHSTVKIKPDAVASW